MITVHNIGRRSNGMIQYAFGRILHELTGMRLVVKNINRDLLETYGINIPYGSGHFEGQEDFQNATAPIEGTVASGEPLQIDDDQLGPYRIGGKENEIPQKLASFALTHDRPIVLHGFFQFAGMYEEWIHQMQQWFWTPNWGQGSESPINSGWCFHIRHGDYAEQLRIPLEYYLRIIKRHGIESFDFIGKDIDIEYMKALINAGGTYHDKGSSIDDWRFLKAHRKIACANSSYSGIAAWLSPEAGKIILPVTKAGYWSRGSEQQFFLPGRNMEEMEV